MTKVKDIIKIVTKIEPHIINNLTNSKQNNSVIINSNTIRKLPLKNQQILKKNISNNNMLYLP